MATKRACLSKFSIAALLSSAAVCLLPAGANAEPRSAAPPASAAAAARPNFVIILADDLGFADPGFNGRREFHTPNLDRLARQGTNFQRFYSGGVICGPSRACLLTGKYTIHNGVSGNGTGLPASETNLAQALKPLGYRSALYGKWDSGGVPSDRGFDEFIGYSNDIEAWEHFPRYLWFDHEKKPVSGYSSDLIASYGAQFVRKNRDHPFLLYLAFIEPHLKLEAPQTDVDRLRKTVPDFDKTRPYNATYAAMIERFDASVGRFLKALDASGQAKNTVVIFTSDNGATFESGNLGASADLDSNRPLRGGKRSVLEGGARMPTVIRWPGHVPAGRVSNSVLDQIDILPTFVKAAGGAVDPAWKVDGKDELAAWEGKARPADRTIFLEYRNDGWFNLAAMSGDWKLVLENKAQFESLKTLLPLDPEKARANEALIGDALAGRRSMASLPAGVVESRPAALGTTDGPRLYNVAKDPSERRNYYFSRPEISLKLRSDLLAWLGTETELSKQAPRTLAPPPPNTPD